MKILQVGDFHIQSKNQIEILKSKTKKMFEAVKDKILKDEELVFCVCGDIVDKGNKEMYEVAETLFNYIKECFKEYNLKFEFVPGNHDLCDNEFKDYDNFILKFNEERYKYNNLENCFLREYEKVDILLANSIYHKSWEYGKIDIDSLDQKIKEKPTLLIVHHTLLSENDEDISAIRNVYKLMEIVEKKNIFAILHGHTHGYKDILLGGKCKIIGVGPMFKDVYDVNNQFNFIELNGNILERISNYRYSADLNYYTQHIVFQENQRNLYNGHSTKKVFDQLVSDTVKDHI